MSETYTFTAVIQGEESGGAYVYVPFDVEQVFGKKRVKVYATIDGEPYRGSVVRMGGPEHMLLVLKEIREKLGKGPGDEVQVTLQEDQEPRTVEIPPDLQALLDGEPALAAFFGQLSYTRQRETVNWIRAAKRDETRQARLAQTLELLRQGKAPR
jgi:hypothetical protein